MGRRGWQYGGEERRLILSAVDQHLAVGARLEVICERLGLSPRTIQRWRTPATAEDRRCGPRTSPANKLSDAERRQVLSVSNSPEFRDASPKQIVPVLADRGVYIASESSFYRVLRAEDQMAHRGKAKAPTARPKPDLVAYRPDQVWSWDITYLKGPVRGSFLYLYLVVDIYSRRIVGWEVHEEESTDRAAALMRRLWTEAGRPAGLRLHSDNGGPMKGATMLSTLQWLGVVPSFSRPSVSDDNPFSESLFRTLKYRPSFPDRPFGSLEQARAWVTNFVRWYNTEHRHSGIRFVTPDERHFGAEHEVLAARSKVYEQARAHHPERWRGATRDWTPAGPVRIGPDPHSIQAMPEARLAA